MILHSWMPPRPHPPTIANITSSYFASRFLVVETAFWLYTVWLIAGQVHAGDGPIIWMAASTTLIFLTLTLPAWIIIMLGRYTPVAMLLAFLAAPANMLAWKHCISVLH